MITTTNTLNNKEAHGFVGANGINFDVERLEIDPVIDAIEQILINRYSYTFIDLKIKSRKTEIVKARNIAIYMIRKFTGMKLKAIGRIFGDRDHSTILHSIATTIHQRNYGYWHDDIYNFESFLLKRIKMTKSIKMNIKKFKKETEEKYS